MARSSGKHVFEKPLYQQKCIGKIHRVSRFVRGLFQIRFLLGCDFCVLPYTENCSVIGTKI